MQFISANRAAAAAAAGHRDLSFTVKGKPGAAPAPTKAPAKVKAPAKAKGA